MLWENLREEEFLPMLEKTNRVCAFALGCVEKHGQHLPLGTDTLEGNGILERAAERAEVCVFPRMYFGDLQGCQAHKAGEGTHYGYIALSAELLLAILREACDEMGRNGFKRIVLFNSHGGNRSWVGNFIRAVRAERKPYEVFLVDNHLVGPKEILAAIEKNGRAYFPAITDADMAVMEDFVAQGKHYGHACFAETAMMMGLYPELVRLDRGEAESGASTGIANPLYEAGINWGGSWSANFPNSYEGPAPTGLTQAIADAAVELAVQNAERALKVIKDDSIMLPILNAAGV